MGKSALLSNGKGSNADKVQDSDTSLLVSNKADKTAKEDYLEDSETTPKSCLGLVLELLATTACTSYSNSLSESVRFLESQLQAKRHRSAVLRQKSGRTAEVPGAFRCILSGATASVGGF